MRSEQERGLVNEFLEADLAPEPAPSPAPARPSGRRPASINAALGTTQEFAARSGTAAPPPIEEQSLVDEFLRGPAPETDVRAGDVLSGVVGEAPRAAGALAGAATGFKLASPLLAAGPVGGVAVAGATLLGLFLGGYAGGLASEGAGLPQEADLPENRRLGYRLGGTLTAGVGGAAVPYAVLRATSPLASVGGPLQSILSAAQNQPVRTALIEAVGVAGAMTGTAAAEFVDPGDPGSRALFELVGGALAPVAVTAASKSATGRIAAAFGERMWAKVAGGASGQGPITPQEQQVAGYIRAIVESAGENVDDVLIPALSRLNPDNLTAGQLTGAAPLVAIQRAISSSLKDVGADMGREARRHLDNVEKTIGLFRKSGDPQAVAAAARLQVQQFQDIVDMRLQASIRQAVNDVAAAGPTGNIQRADAGKIADTAVTVALRELRDVESALYTHVPKDAPARSLQGIDKAYAEQLARRLGDADPLPQSIRAAVAHLTQRADEGALNSGDLMQFRSLMLSRLRSEDPLDKMNRAAYSALGEAALRDLDGVFSATPREGGLVMSQSEAYDTARRMSNSIGDAYSRAFPGEAQLGTGAGGQRIAPELILERAMAGGGVAAELRMQQLRQIADMAALESVNSDNALFARYSMRRAQEEVIRYAVRDISDPSSGRIAPQKFAAFARDNENILAPFPELQQAFQRAARSEQAAQDLALRLKGVSDNSIVLSRLQDVAQAARLTQPGAPAEAVVDLARRAIESRTPIADMQGLIRAAVRGGDDAKQGLRVAFMEAALKNARNRDGADGKLDFSALHETFLAPRTAVTPDGQSRKFTLLDTLTESGAFSKAEAEQITAALTKARNIQSTLARGEVIDIPADKTDLWTNFVLSYVGARAGSQMARNTGAGGQLVIAQRAASAARELFSRAGMRTHENVLVDLIRNPKRLADALQTPPNAVAQFTAERAFHAYLLNVGILTAEDFEDEQ